MEDRKKKILIIGGISILLIAGGVIVINKIAVNKAIKKGMTKGVEKISKEGISNILSNLGTGDISNKYVKYALSKYGIKIIK